jgi:16S rRNA (uracil1498-N3)-methyltransferase
MRVPRFYTDQALRDSHTLSLEQEPSHHLLRVLRLRRGDPLVLFNGDGRDYRARLAGISGTRAIVDIVDVFEPGRESPLRIELGQGISRGERMDFALQKSVELGIGAVTPLWTARSQVSLTGARLEKRLNHWRGVMRSASEQSGRAVIPILRNALALEEWCRENTAELRLVLDPEAPLPLRDLPRPDSVSILVGPEGGLEAEEIGLAEARGFRRVRLGPRILRTETAALAALTAVQTLWGDLAG